MSGHVLVVIQRRRDDDVGAVCLWTGCRHVESEQCHRMTSRPRTLLKFHRAKVLGTLAPEERKFHGAKVLGLFALWERMLYGAKVPQSESSWNIRS